MLLVDFCQSRRNRAVGEKRIFTTMQTPAKPSLNMVDITNLDVEVGDDVELFGKHISIQEVAKTCDTIPYEILSRISMRVKRVYSEE